MVDIDVELDIVFFHRQVDAAAILRRFVGEVERHAFRLGLRPPNLLLAAQLDRLFLRRFVDILDDVIFGDLLADVFRQSRPSSSARFRPSRLPFSPLPSATRAPERACPARWRCDPSFTKVLFAPSRSPFCT